MKLGLIIWYAWLLIFAIADPAHGAAKADLKKRSGQDGRLCDFTDNYYVSWSDCTSAIKTWCGAHANQNVSLGQSIDDGNIGGFMSGHWKVEMYIKYQNDHANPVWTIDEEACNWYVNYIAQGCTKGGNRPSDVGKQFSDGGTFYEPLMGSVDFKWQATN